MVEAAEYEYQPAVVPTYGPPPSPADWQLSRPTSFLSASLPATYTGAEPKSLCYLHPAIFENQPFFNAPLAGARQRLQDLQNSVRAFRGALTTGLSNPESEFERLREDADALHLHLVSQLATSPVMPQQVEPCLHTLLDIRNIQDEVSQFSSDNQLTMLAEEPRGVNPALLLQITRQPFPVVVLKNKPVESLEVRLVCGVQTQILACGPVSVQPLATDTSKPLTFTAEPQASASLLTFSPLKTASPYFISKCSTGPKKRWKRLLSGATSPL